MKNTAKYAWSFSRNSSFLRGLFYYAAPCILLKTNICYNYNLKRPSNKEMRILQLPSLLLVLCTTTVRQLIGVSVNLQSRGGTCHSAP